MGEPKKRIERKKRAAPVVTVKPTATDAPPPRPRRPRDDRASTSSLDGPKFVGGPRNEHGTRVARRVTCQKCGTSDHVPYVPKNPANALCRNCAAEVLKTFEAGTKAPMEMKPAVCSLCGTPFQLPSTVVFEKDQLPLCRSCLRGFATWQGSKDVPFEERGQTVVEERLSGALVRKRKRDN
jgi:ribosomal protein S14